MTCFFGMRPCKRHRRLPPCLLRALAGCCCWAAWQPERGAARTRRSQGPQGNAWVRRRGASDCVMKFFLVLISHKIGSRFSGFRECGEEKELGGPFASQLVLRTGFQFFSAYRPQVFRLFSPNSLVLQNQLVVVSGSVVFV